MTNKLLTLEELSQLVRERFVDDVHAVLENSSPERLLRKAFDELYSQQKYISRTLLGVDSSGQLSSTSPIRAEIAAQIGDLIQKLVAEAAAEVKDDEKVREQIKAAAKRAIVQRCRDLSSGYDRTLEVSEEIVREVQDALIQELRAELGLSNLTSYTP